MAGVKGKSGGARPGAGKPPVYPREPAVVAPDDAATARQFLEAVMRGKIVPSLAQLDAAKTLVRVDAAPPGGKKEVLAAKAKRAGSGKFAAATAPLKLVSR